MEDKLIDGDQDSTDVDTPNEEKFVGALGHFVHLQSRGPPRAYNAYSKYALELMVFQGTECRSLEGRKV